MTSLRDLYTDTDVRHGRWAHSVPSSFVGTLMCNPWCSSAPLYSKPCPPKCGKGGKSKAPSEAHVFQARSAKACLKVGLFSLAHVRSAPSADRDLSSRGSRFP